MVRAHMREALHLQEMKRSAHKHIGFQAAAWYRHFVDVVGLFLFVWVYWLLGLPIREFTAG
jgi:heme/copper-type cytochrome/quinol oxidase subunit 3